MRKLEVVSVCGVGAWMMTMSFIWPGSSASAQSDAGLPCPKKFTARYEMETDGNAENEVQVFSNGGGKIALVLKEGGIRTLVDCMRSEVVYINDSKKRLTRVHAERLPEIANDARTIKVLRMQDAGQKDVGGHPCHGFTETKNGVTNLIWMGDDIGCVVLNKAIGKNDSGSFTARSVLKEWSGDCNAPADVFEIPNYKVGKVGAPP